MTTKMSIRNKVETVARRTASILSIAALGTLGVLLGGPLVMEDVGADIDSTSDTHKVVTPPTAADVPDRWQSRCVANDEWASDAYPRRGVVSPKDDPTNFKTVSFDRAMRMAERKTHWWVMSCG